MHGNTFGPAWFRTMGKQTTNLASVGLTTLKAFPIPKIPIDEQRRLVTQVEAQTTQIVAFERIVELALRRAAALGSAILSSALDGQLVSQDPGAEAASILLDRIASERGSSNSHDKATGTRPARTVRPRVTAMSRSTADQIVQKLWNYCNVLRDDGLSYQDYIEQLTFLLFLKMADEQTKPPFNREPIVPAGLDWASLVALDGMKLEAPMPRDHQWQSSSTNCPAPSVSCSRRRRTRSRITCEAQTPDASRSLIGAETCMSLSADVKGDAYEGLLATNAEDVKTGAGQYFTPRVLIAAIVEVMRPEP